MSVPRAILATLIAALMGAPICCCAYETQSETAEQQASCCHSSTPLNQENQQPEDHVCACRTKDPRESAKEPKLPVNQGTELAPPPMKPIEPEMLEPMSINPARAVVTGSDPPTRLRLARLSRWLN